MIDNLLSGILLALGFVFVIVAIICILSGASTYAQQVREQLELEKGDKQ